MGTHIDEKVFNIEMQSVLSTSFKQQYGFFDKKISQYKIHYKDMLYIEFLNRHTIIHFVNNIEKKTTYPLKYWIEELSNKGFGQPYKSFLVNLDYVSGFSSDGKDIIMNNGEKSHCLKISKSHSQINILLICITYYDDFSIRYTHSYFYYTFL